MRNNDLSPTVREMIAQRQEPQHHPLEGQRVYICSPYRGDHYANARWARSYCLVLAHEGIIPVAPHLFYTQFLSDAIKTSRTIGLQFGLKDLELCKEIWVFLPSNGIPTEGMQGEIALAEALGIKVRLFRFKMGEHELRMAIRKMAMESPDCGACTDPSHCSPLAKACYGENICLTCSAIEGCQNRDDWAICLGEHYSPRKSVGQ